MQGLVNRLATCSTDDGDNKEGETTRGHWLEHHEHSASSVATLYGLKTVTARGYRQGHIEPPKAARGHENSYSARIDGIVLSVTKNNVSG